MDESESLGTGLERGLDRLNDVQLQMANFAQDLGRLKTQCDALKRERTTLRQDLFSAEQEKNTVARDIERLLAERDSLQIEFAALCEDERYLLQADALASAELQANGRLARQLWLAQEKVKELESRVSESDARVESAVVAERGIAASLRERIGRLERRLREKDDGDGEGREKELEYEAAVLKDEMTRLDGQYSDSLEALLHERRERAVAAERADRLSEQLLNAREEVIHYKALGAERDRLALELDKLKATLAKTERPSAEREPLQPVSPNHNTPRTPSKTVPPSPKDTPSAKQLAHLEKQHAALKAAHDRLKAKYASDIKHWKEYRAVEMARKEARQKRREGRADSRIPSSSAVASLPVPPSLPSAPSAPSGPPSSQPAAPAADDDQPPRLAEPVADNIVKTEPSTAIPKAEALTPQTRSEQLVPSKRKEPPTEERPRSVTDPSKPTPSNKPLSDSHSTPSSKAIGATRVTPWLGAGRSSKKISRRDSFSDDESTPSAAPPKPLVRDRGETSLRKAALQRTVTVDQTDADALTVTTPKRPLDFEHLSPAERAAERRKLSRLSTAERREVYAPYKGSGRYLPPDAQQKTVADEYEIDPARNDGVGHQFHEVVRSKEARRKMHGGDCECCRDYYAALGPIPRFNQAPAWSDAAETASAAGHPAALPGGSALDREEHQNRTSRHRETWRRPPTPPEYWAIKFPTTQEVAEVNARADEMVRAREEEMRRETELADGKWRRKA